MFQSCPRTRGLEISIYANYARCWYVWVWESHSDECINEDQKKQICFSQAWLLGPKPFGPFCPNPMTCSHPKANTSLQLEVESMNKPTYGLHLGTTPRGRQRALSAWLMRTRSRWFTWFIYNRALRLGHYRRKTFVDRYIRAGKQKAFKDLGPKLYREQRKKANLVNACC